MGCDTEYLRQFLESRNISAKSLKEDLKHLEDWYAKQPHLPHDPLSKQNRENSTEKFYKHFSNKSGCLIGTYLLNYFAFILSDFILVRGGFANCLAACYGGVLTKRKCFFSVQRRFFQTLVATNWSLEKTKVKIDNLYALRNKFSEILQGRDPCDLEIEKYLRTPYAIILPKRTRDNERVIISR